MTPPPPRSTLFPYTSLFRSSRSVPWDRSRSRGCPSPSRYSSWSGPEWLVPDQLEYLDGLDRKSTRLNSSHITSSYAVFCLKKKKKTSLTFQYAYHVR